MIISAIGTHGTTPLLCHTNRAPTGSPFNSGGNWISPSNITVGQLDSDNVPGFVRNRDPMEVRLWRTTDNHIPAKGIYHCEVMDALEREKTVYVGLYNDGGGKFFVCVLL